LVLFVDNRILGKEFFDMLIDFKCPHCQIGLQVGSDFAGKTGACPKCKKEITVPEQNAGTQSDKEEPAKKE
jgi:hypothetical protein